MKTTKQFFSLIFLVSITLTACSKMTSPTVNQPSYNPPNGSMENTIPNAMPTDLPEMFNGEKDTHGCIPSAGYTWDEVAGMCIRKK